MGNSAIITTKDKGLGLYLHWNGGRDSVEPFLEYCRLQGYRCPEQDKSYAFARLAQVIANYFGGSTSIGIIENCGDSICSDNGNYIIGRNFEIVGRDYPYENFKEQNEYNLMDMLKEIDESQPTINQLGDFLYAPEKEVSSLKKGDMVYIQDYDGKYDKYAIVGFGKDKVINGTNVLGKPYIKKYGTRDDYKENINNYLLTEKIRVYEKANTMKKDKSEELEV